MNDVIRTLDFEKHRYGIYTYHIVPNLEAGEILIVAVKSNQSIEEIRSHFPACVKIGPTDRIRQLVNMQTPGYRLKAIDSEKYSLKTEKEACFEICPNEAFFDMHQLESISLHVGRELGILSITMSALKVG